MHNRHLATPMDMEFDPAYIQSPGSNNSNRDGYEDALAGDPPDNLENSFTPTTTEKMATVFSDHISDGVADDIANENSEENIANDPGADEFLFNEVIENVRRSGRIIKPVLSRDFYGETELLEMERNGQFSMFRC